MAKNTNPFNLPAGTQISSNGFEVKRSNNTSGYSGNLFPDRGLLKQVADEAYEKSMIELGLMEAPEPYVPTEEEVLMEQLFAKLGVEGVKNLLNGNTEKQEEPQQQQLIIAHNPPPDTVDNSNSSIILASTNDLNDDDFMIDMITKEITGKNL